MTRNEQVAAHELVDWLADCAHRTARGAPNDVQPVCTKAGPAGFSVELLYKGTYFRLTLEKVAP